LVSKERNVHSAVGLSRNPEFVLAEFWEFLEPLSQRSQIISSSTGIIEFIVRVVVDREANPWRTFQEEQIGIVVPRVGVAGLREFI
jgi:hypothetical protein